MPGFGTLHGQDVALFTLRAAQGMTATITPYGARLVGLCVPDRNGRMGDVVLGHDDLSGYLAHRTYFGATCGRYANRIAEGRFVLDGRVVQLDRNEGANHLHGGAEGLDRRLWTLAAQDDRQIRLTTTSAAGEMGYPGTLDVATTYRFADDGAFQIEMTATTDAPTIVNLVNHAYFNLAGQGDVLDHLLELPADFYTPVRSDLIVTGEVRAVAGTGFDFRKPRSLRAAMATDPACAEGHDHNWCLRGDDPQAGLHLSARLTDPLHGRRMELRSNQPGVQVYTCGQMKIPVPGKAGASYGRFAGLTFETQLFPGSPNHLHFPQARLDPGQVYTHRMELRFDTVA